MVKRKSKASLQGVVNNMMQKEEHSMLSPWFYRNIWQIYTIQIMHHNCQWWETFIVDMNGHNIA
jgi:hypothetical protein